MKLTCRVPLRIDLAGGWSDIPPFARREGGAVLNVAITQYVTGQIERDERADQGALRISYGLDLPSGTGLGSSAALSVAWLALVRANIGQPLDRVALAGDACELGALLGILGGKQDEYAAALGGVNLMRFDEEVHVERLELLAGVQVSLESGLVLCYSGRPRLSGDIHDRVWGAYERGDGRVAAHLRELRDIAVAMRDVLLRGDLEAVAELMNRNWRAQKGLHASITNEDVERLYRTALDAGALAGKACGAGGGGCLVFIAHPERVADVRAALANAGAQLLDVAIDRDGAVVEP